MPSVEASGVCNRVDGNCPHFTPYALQFGVPSAYIYLQGNNSVMTFGGKRREEDRVAAACTQEKDDTLICEIGQGPYNSVHQVCTGKRFYGYCVALEVPDLQLPDASYKISYKCVGGKFANMGHKDGWKKSNIDWFECQT